MKREGPPKKRVPLTPEIEETIRALSAKGNSIDRIAAATEIGYDRVRKFLHDDGLWENHMRNRPKMKGGGPEVRITTLRNGVDLLLERLQLVHPERAPQ